MTDFCKTLTALCRKTNISIETAMKMTTAYRFDADQAAYQITENGYVPDEKTVHELAAYFGVGTDMFRKSKHERENTDKVYLAGPITGYPDFMSRFKDAHAYLESQKFKVFNPAFVTACLPSTHMERQDFIDLGIVLLGMCDAIALMPGYEESTGCCAEKAYAVANRMRVIELLPEHLELGHKLLLDGPFSGDTMTPTP